MHTSTNTKIFSCFKVLSLLIFCSIFVHKYAFASDIEVSFGRSTINVSKNQVFETNINLQAGSTTKVSGASLLIKYPSNILSFQGAEPNTECKQNNFKLSQLLEAKDDPKTGILKISRVLIGPDSVLPTGSFCFSTLTFKAKPSFWFWFPWYKRSGKVTFSDINKWQLVGPTGANTASTNMDLATIKVTETN